MSGGNPALPVVEWVGAVADGPALVAPFFGELSRYPQGNITSRIGKHKILGWHLVMRYCLFKIFVIAHFIEFVKGAGIIWWFMSDPSQCMVYRFAFFRCFYFHHRSVMSINNRIPYGITATNFNFFNPLCCGFPCSVMPVFLFSIILKLNFIPIHDIWAYICGSPCGLLIKPDDNHRAALQGNSVCIIAGCWELHFIPDWRQG